MINRPLNQQFSQAVREGRKITTIRDNVWPIGKDIMLYNWSGAAYRSKQTDVAVVRVQGYWPIEITHHASGHMQYDCGMDNGKFIYETEGFSSREEMDAWFRPLVKPMQTVSKILMRFRVVELVKTK